MDRAHLQSLQHLGVTSQLTGREELHLNPALTLAFNYLFEQLHFVGLRIIGRRGSDPHDHFVSSKCAADKEDCEDHGHQNSHRQ